MNSRDPHDIEGARVELLGTTAAAGPTLTRPVTVRMLGSAETTVDRHVRTDTEVEQGGVLVGDFDASTGVVLVTAAIPAFSAVSRAASLTFTHDTWEHVNEVIERDHAGGRMVGWYHSHPHFGIFLSDYDQFIHENFFSQPWQVAYVVDPLLRQKGMFGWDDRHLGRFDSWEVVSTIQGVDSTAPVGQPPAPETKGAFSAPRPGKTSALSRIGLFAFGLISGLLAIAVIGVVSGRDDGVLGIAGPAEWTATAGTRGRTELSIASDRPVHDLQLSVSVQDGAFAASVTPPAPEALASGDPDERRTVVAANVYPGADVPNGPYTVTVEAHACRVEAVPCPPDDEVTVSRQSRLAVVPPLPTGIPVGLSVPVAERFTDTEAAPHARDELIVLLDLNISPDVANEALGQVQNAAIDSGASVSGSDMEGRLFQIRMINGDAAGMDALRERLIGIPGVTHVIDHMGLIDPPLDMVNWAGGEVRWHTDMVGELPAVPEGDDPAGVRVQVVDGPAVPAGDSLARLACRDGARGTPVKPVSALCTGETESLTAEPGGPLSVLDVYEAMMEAKDSGARVVVVATGFAVTGDCTLPPGDGLSEVAAAVSEILRRPIELSRAGTGNGSAPDVLWVLPAGDGCKDTAMSAPGRLGDDDKVGDVVLTVAAVDEDGKPTASTNGGSAVDLAGPGGLLPSPCAAPNPADGCPPDVGSSSTAEAATVVAGVAAHLMATSPGLTVTDVAGCLVTSGILRTEDRQQISCS